VRRVSEFDREVTIMGRPWSTRGCCVIGGGGGGNFFYFFLFLFFIFFFNQKIGFL